MEKRPILPKWVLRTARKAERVTSPLTAWDWHKTVDGIEYDKFGNPVSYDVLKLLTSYENLGDFSSVYISKVFTKTSVPALQKKRNIFRGGTGFYEIVVWMLVCDTLSTDKRPTGATYFILRGSARRMERHVPFPMKSSISNRITRCTTPMSPKKSPQERGCRILITIKTTR